MDKLSRGLGTDSAALARRVARMESFLAGFRKEQITANVLGFSRRHRIDVLASLGGPVDDGPQDAFTPIFRAVDGRTPKEIDADNAKLATFTANAAKMSGAEAVAAYGKIAEAASLHIAKSATYKVKVTDGVIVDHAIIGDVPDYRKCHNQLDKDNQPVEFEIKVGQAVYVGTKTLPTGAIGTTDPNGFACAIVVDEDGKKSVHYAPPVEDDPGRAGIVYYKLASLDEIDEKGRMVITYYYAGANIVHYRDRAGFRHVGDGCYPFIRFDPEADEYKLRGFKGRNGVTVTQDANNLWFELGSGYPGVLNNLNLTVETRGIDLGGRVSYGGEGTSTILDPISTIVHYWRNGDYVGTVNPGGVPAGLIVETLTKLVPIFA